jgi:DNA-binding response OmpR family regulator
MTLASKRGSTMRILVVEDETALLELIRQGLQEEGHAVDAVGSAEDAVDWIEPDLYDAIVLDIMLPGRSGIQLCCDLRAHHIATPILLLTAKDDISDRVAGLDAGADDYLVKAFAFAELCARLRAITRRPAESLDPVLVAGELRLDPARHRVTLGAEEVDLSNKEFRLLELMMRRRGTALTRAMITDALWDYDFPNATNVIDVYIASLRRKLNDPYPGRMIETIRGVGYRFQADR